MRVLPLLAAAGLLAVSSGPLLAQYSNAPPKSLMQLEYEEQVKRRDQNDKDYQATMRRLRASDGVSPQQPQDPWGNVRSQPQTGSGKK